MRSTMNRIASGLWKEFQELPTLPILILMFIASCFFVRNFASAYNMRAFLLQTVDLLVICCGITFVLLNGGIDFSVTSIVSLNSVAGAYIMVLSPLSGNPAVAIFAAVVVMIALGLLTGLLNGISVAYLRMPSFIATLATQLALSGIAILFRSSVTEKISITGIPESFFALGGVGAFFPSPLSSPSWPGVFVIGFVPIPVLEEMCTRLE